MKISLGNLITWSKGNIPTDVHNEKSTGDLPYLTTTYLNGNERKWVDPLDPNAVVVPRSSILISWDGSAGQVFMAPCKGVLSSTMGVIHIKEGAGIINAYLGLVMLSNQSRIQGRSRGTTIKHVDPKFLANLPITVPPLSEQRRIVVIMDSIEDSISSKRDELDKLRTLRQGVLQDELSDERAERENWEKKKLGDVLHRSKKPVKLEEDRIYKQVTVGLHGIGARLRCESVGDFTNSPQFGIEKDQFIASKIDARNGAIAIVPAELDGAIVTNDFPVWSINENQALIRYLYWNIQQGSLTDLCSQASLGTTNRKRVNPELLESLSFSIPPLPVQQWIVDKLDSIQDMIDAVEAELAALETLRQGKLEELIPC